MKNCIKKSQENPNELIEYYDKDFAIFFYKKKILKIDISKAHMKDVILEELSMNTCHICDLESAIHVVCQTCIKSLCQNCYSKVDKCPFCRN